MGTDWQRVTRPSRLGLTAGDIGLEPPKDIEPGAWFLGPNGENVEEMAALLGEALRDHAAARAAYGQAFGHDDPPFIPQDMHTEKRFTDTIESIRQNLARLSAKMRASTPMSSYRNKSHMNWDITMPGALGYFAAMMFNANNVAPEASPVTTVLELETGKDLCKMLGFGGGKRAPEPWGHITCDGSIANTEAMWEVGRRGSVTIDARHLTVRLGDGRFAELLDLEPWELVNLPNEVILDLPRRLEDERGLDKRVVKAALDTYGLQALGMVRFHAEVLQGLSPGIVIVPATAHYSWDKGVTILGLGKQALRHVPVDLEARMSVPHLRRVLDACLEEELPVIQVVAVAGSTAESAVDPIDAISGLRAEYAYKGLSFTLHADAAWGGYFRTMLIGPKGGDTIAPADPLSAHVTTQLTALERCDTITQTTCHPRGSTGSKGRNPARRRRAWRCRTRPSRSTGRATACCSAPASSMRNASTRAW